MSLEEKIRAAVEEVLRSEGVGGSVGISVEVRVVTAVNGGRTKVRREKFRASDRELTDLDRKLVLNLPWPCKHRKILDAVREDPRFSITEETVKGAYKDPSVCAMILNNFLHGEEAPYRFSSRGGGNQIRGPFRLYAAEE